MKKVFTVEALRDLDQQHTKGEISYSRMIEILNEKSNAAFAPPGPAPIAIEVYWDKIVQQFFIPTAKNAFGEVRHTGVAKKDVKHLKAGKFFETWLMPNSFKFYNAKLTPAIYSFDNPVARVQTLYMTYEQYKLGLPQPINFRLNWKTHFVISEVPKNLAEELKAAGMTIEIKE